MLSNIPAEVEVCDQDPVEHVLHEFPHVWALALLTSNPNTRISRQGNETHPFPLVSLGLEKVIPVKYKKNKVFSAKAPSTGVRKEHSWFYLNAVETGWTVRC